MKIRGFVATALLAGLGWAVLPASTNLMPIEEIENHVILGLRR